MHAFFENRTRKSGMVNEMSMNRHLFEFYSDMLVFLDKEDAIEKLRTGHKFRVSYKKESYVLEWFQLGDCVEIYTPTFDDSRHVYMHVHDGPIQVGVNDKLVFESAEEPTKEDLAAKEAYAKLGGVHA